MNRETEPVRLYGWVALVVGLALLAALGWALDVGAKAIVAQVVVVALTQVRGLEFARKHAWSPSTHRAELNLAKREGQS